MADKRKNQTAVSDEEIVAALLNSGSIQQAAEKTGLAPRTMYDRMGTRDFRAAYSAAKSDIMRQAVLSMNRNLSAAVDVVMNVMTDDNNPAAVRLQAAKLLLENAARFTDRLADADRATAELATDPTAFDMSKW